MAHREEGMWRWGSLAQVPAAARAVRGCRVAHERPATARAGAGACAQPLHLVVPISSLLSTCHIGSVWQVGRRSVRMSPPATMSPLMPSWQWATPAQITW